MEFNPTDAEALAVRSRIEFWSWRPHWPGQHVAPDRCRMNIPGGRSPIGTQCLRKARVTILGSGFCRAHAKRIAGKEIS